MEKINLLPKLNIPSTIPSVYDRESKTCIEMTAKVYGAMRELQEEYNVFVDEFNKTITEFMDGTNQDQEEFKAAITKLIHDYIEALDAKIDHQDRVIEENITYIKNNIGTEVTRIIDEMKSSGELDAIIADSLDSVNEKILTLESDVNVVKENVSALVPKVITNETNIKALQTSTTNLDDRVNDLEEMSNIDIEARNEIEKIKSKRKMIVIGDSFSSPTYNPVESAWYTLVAQQLNLDVYNYAKDGAGYVKAGSNNTTFSIEVDRAIEDTSFNNDDVNLVIVYGGLNDMDSSYVGSLYTNAKSLINKIKNNFKNARVIIAGINAWPSGLFVNGRETTLNYMHKLKDAASDNGVAFINTCLWLIGNSECYDSSNNHPNVKGNSITAHEFLSSLTGGTTIKNYVIGTSNLEDGSGRITAEANSNTIILSGECKSTENNLNVSIPMPKNIIGAGYQNPGFIATSTTDTAWINFDNNLNMVIHTPKAGTYYFRCIIPIL